MARSLTMMASPDSSHAQTGVDAQNRSQLVAWTLTMPWPTPPLSLNDRGHWTKHAKKIAAVREWAALAATEARIPRLQRCVVELVWFVTTHTHRDEENPVATLKPACDGLVDAGVVPDDTPDYMSKLMPRVVYRKSEPGVELIVHGVTYVTHDDDEQER